MKSVRLYSHSGIGLNLLSAGVNSLLITLHDVGPCCTCTVLGHLGLCNWCHIKVYGPVCSSVDSGSDDLGFDSRLGDRLS